MKCTDTNISNEERTFNIIEALFIETFIPTDETSKARHTLVLMKMEGEPYHSNFCKFKSDFKLEAAQSRVTNEHILMNMLGRAVSSNLAFKMMALLEEPKTHKLWLQKAGQFYNTAQQMRKLQEGTTYLPPFGHRKTTKDPMAMDVD